MTTDIRFGTDGWRAVIGDDFTYDNLRRVADAAGRVFAADNPGGTVLVGYDTRFEAGSFAAAAAEVLAAHGLTVQGLRPLPAHAGAVLVGRARRRGGRRRHAHREPQPQRVPRLQAAHGRRRRLAGRVHRPRRGRSCSPRPPDARGEFEVVDLVGPYLADLRALVDADAIRAANLRVVVDPLYGAGQTYLAETLRSLGVDVTEIHGERNPGFGGLHPEPIPPWIDATARARARRRASTPRS